MEYSYEFFDIKVIRSCAKTVSIHLTLKNVVHETIVSYVAAKSPDYRQSYSGSALPFPDAQIAFENSPNFGAHKIRDRLTFTIDFPNSYYSHVGTRIILPHVRIELMDLNKKKFASEIIKLGEIAPFRLLSYPSIPAPRDSPLFYSREHLTKPRSQEQILRSSGYSHTTPKNFWNGAIPHP
tara:strand:- start:7016 stop:7558 length:543 start_codon:yes stop_codon:yes gene_type:complete